tara:strand:+ start:523 stop:1119 length:597 start_codon:yes stop_codon:yes gene_type:complete
MTSKLIVNSIRHTGASADAITMDASGNVTFPANATCSGTAAGFGGITMVDNWRLSVGFVGGTQDLTSNWERNDDNFSKIGTGMTESSGIFTFPETGIYRIDFSAGAVTSNQQVRYMGGIILLTDNGLNSGFAERASGYQSISNDVAAYCNIYLTTFFDVTDTSTHKAKFRVESEHSLTWDASNSSNRTYATFTRLGDT